MHAELYEYGNFRYFVRIHYQRYFRGIVSWHVDPKDGSLHHGPEGQVSR